MTSPLTQAVSWALVNLVWQGALVAAALAVALRIVPGRHSRTRYALACGALLVLTVLPVVSAAQRYSLRAATPPVAPVVASLPAEVVNEISLSADVVPSAPAGAAAADARELLARVDESCERHARWIVLVWALGVLCGSARVLSGWRRVVRLCARAEPAGPEIQTALQRLCAALGIRRAVRVLVSRDITVPAAVGWLRPVVLVPMAALGGLSAAELELVLRHELAHVRRHDYLVNLVQTAAETLLFFHPAVWWIGNVIRSERENCCDDLALAGGATPLSYARALTALESLRVLPSPALSALGGSLPQRVRRLVLPRERCRARWSAGATLLPLFSGFAVACQLVAAALPEKTEEAVPEPVSRSHAPATEEIREEVQEDVQGEEPALSIDELVTLSAAGVTAEYLDEMQAQFGPLSAQQVANLRALGVTREYVASLEAAGCRDLGPEEAATARAVGLDASYVEDLRALGVPVEDTRVLQGLRGTGVTPEWIRAMRAEGLRDLSVEEMHSLRGLGVDPEYVREMHGAGLDGLSVDDLLKLRAAGITREYLERLRGP